jgi:hypothetical protein
MKYYNNPQLQYGYKSLPVTSINPVGTDLEQYRRKRHAWSKSDTRRGYADTFDFGPDPHVVELLGKTKELLESNERLARYLNDRPR